MSGPVQEICMPCNPAFRWAFDHTRCLRYRTLPPGEGVPFACACPDRYHDSPNPPDAYRGPMPAEWPASR